MLTHLFGLSQSCLQGPGGMGFLASLPPAPQVRPMAANGPFLEVPEVKLGVEELDEDHQKAQTSNYKINKYEECNVYVCSVTQACPTL